MIDLSNMLIHPPCLLIGCLDLSPHLRSPQMLKVGARGCFWTGTISPAILACEHLFPYPSLVLSRRPRLEGLMDLYSQGYERSYTVNSSILHAIEPHLKDFQQLLLNPPKVRTYSMAVWLINLQWSVGTKKERDSVMKHTNNTFSQNVLI